MLKYVQNKDVFMRYYKTHLTRRLILETSADSEKEEAMVEWLREVGMPAEYINKLARMFQDIKVSEDLNRQFKDQHKDSAMSGKSTRGLFCQLVHFCYNCTDILFQLYRYPLPTVQISSSNCTDILFQLYRYPLPTVQISST